MKLINFVVMSFLISFCTFAEAKSSCSDDAKSPIISVKNGYLVIKLKLSELEAGGEDINKLVEALKGCKSKVKNNKHAELLKNICKILDHIELYEMLLEGDEKKLPKDLEMVQGKLKTLRYLYTHSKGSKRAMASRASYFGDKIDKIGDVAIVYFGGRVDKVGSVNIEYFGSKVDKIGSLIIRYLGNEIDKIGEYDLDNN